MPTESWTTFSSNRLPYRIRMPEGWAPRATAESQKDEFWAGANLLTIEIATNASELTPAEWSRLSEANLASIGFRVASSELTVIPGIEARLFEARLKRFLKKDIHVMRASFHDGTYGWDVTLSVGDGTVEPDRSLFIKVLTTFQRLDVLLAADDTSGNAWALQPGECFASLPLQVAAEGLTVYLGGVDGFRRVACSEPHTGEVAAVLETIDIGNVAKLEHCFEAHVGAPLSKSEYGILIMHPDPRENVPSGVRGLLVIAHPAGPRSGSARGSGN